MLYLYFRVSASFSLKDDWKVLQRYDVALVDIKISELIDVWEIFSVTLLSNCGIQTIVKGIASLLS